MMVATCAVLGFMLVSPKSREPKQVQEDIAVLESMEAKSDAACFKELKSADERQRWAAAVALSRTKDNLFATEVHDYLVRTKDINDSAASVFMREIAIQKTPRSNAAMADLMAKNSILAHSAIANYLHSRSDIKPFQTWMAEQNDPRVLQAIIGSLGPRPNALNLELVDAAKRRLKELS